MARRVVVARTKTKIPYLISQTHQHKIIDPREITNGFSEFYSKLYNLEKYPAVPPPSPSDIDDFLKTASLPSLTEAQLADLNATIDEEEIATVITSLPMGKAPGPDGFSNEYYRAFKCTLAPYIGAAFNQAVARGELPMEMLQATIVTLPKPCKSPDQPANF